MVTPAAAWTTLLAMDEKAIRRAAVITLRRAILQNFPPGPYDAARMGYRALDEVRAAKRRLHAVSAAVRNGYHRS
jgi:hypothetical protein